MEYIKRTFTNHFETISQGSEEDYVINLIQMKKLVKIINFLECHGDEDVKVTVRNTLKREKHGYIDVTFYDFNIIGAKRRALFFEKFSELIQEASELNINAIEDGRVKLSITISNIYIHRSKVRD